MKCHGCEKGFEILRGVHYAPDELTKEPGLYPYCTCRNLRHSKVQDFPDTTYGLASVEE